MSKVLRGVIVLALVIVVLFCGTASADTLTVGSSGCDYTKIQDAVDAAGAGDTILVYNGIYTENLWINNKDLAIRGEDRETTIINGGGSGDCIRVSRADVDISGFTIKNVGGHGVYVYGSDLNLSNATIRDCEDDAIYFTYGKTLTLRDSVLENSGGGLVYDDYYKASATGNAKVERNIIRNNTGDGLYIKLASRKNAVINDNIIINSTGSGIYCMISGDGGLVTMKNNIVKNSGKNGMYLVGVVNVVIANTTVDTVKGYGLYAPECDLSIINATIRCCGDDAIYFTYGKTLTLRDSVLENSGGGLVYNDYYKASATGNAKVERNIIRNNTGDGLYIKLASRKNAVINDNIIINSTGSGSDGIYCRISGDGGLVTMKNNTVKNSGSDGVYLSGAKDSTLLNNTVISNRGHGISLYSSHSFLIFHNNLINNSPNAYDSDPASNDWYHPVLLEGNYWSDYTGDDDGSGTEKHDMVGDGIGDTDIPHPGEDYDHYPFVNERGWLIQHDIAVTNIDAPVFVEVNLTIMINSTVWNFGLSNESNITVDFIMDGVSQSTTTIPFLKSGSYTNVCFQWTAPSVAGMHDIMVYAEPMVDETIEWNNKLNKIITVGDIWVPDTYPTIQQAATNATACDTIIVRDGIYAENVDVNKSLTILSENKSALTIVQAANPDDDVFEVTADYVNISGFTVTGTDEAGFYLCDVNCCNISDNNVSNNGKGIYLHYSSNCTLMNNNASSNSGTGSYKRDGYGYGIYLHSSSNCTLMGNIANSNSGTGFYNYDGYGYGIYLHSSSNCTLMGNIANSNSGSGGEGHDPYEFFGGDGYSYGIYLNSSSNCMLTGNTAYSNSGIGGRGENADEWNEWGGGSGGDGYGNGIYLQHSSNCILTNNTANSISNGGRGGLGQYGGIGGDGGNSYSYGIYMDYSSNCILTSNTANSINGSGGRGGDGIHDADGGDGGDGYGYGIYLHSSSNCMLMNNTAYSINGSGGSGGRGGSGSGGRGGGDGHGCGYGIHLNDSSNHNTLYHNNLIANVENAYDDSDTNTWDSGSAGNYWSDYNGTDNNTDGIGDDPHLIPGGTGVDHFPLMQPWTGGTSLKGDLNSDGILTPADAAIALRIAATGAQNPAADVNDDGRITSLDALMILQAAAGAIEL